MARLQFHREGSSVDFRDDWHDTFGCPSYPAVGLHDNPAWPGYRIERCHLNYVRPPKERPQIHESTSLLQHRMDARVSGPDTYRQDHWRREIRSGCRARQRGLQLFPDKRSGLWLGSTCSRADQIGATGCGPESFKPHWRGRCPYRPKTPGGDLRSGLVRQCHCLPKVSADSESRQAALVELGARIPI